MTDEEAQKKAEKVQELSLSVLKLSHTLANVRVAIDLASEDVYQSAILIAEIAKDLPLKVREKLNVVVPKQEGDDEEGKDSLVDWIRRVLKGENNQ